MPPSTAPRDASGRNPGAKPTEPTTIWQAIKWDVVVLVAALTALVANLLIPDTLSPGLAPLLFLAAAWVGYRMFRKIQAVRARA